MKKLIINVGRVEFEMNKKKNAQGKPWGQSDLARALGVRRQYVNYELFNLKRCSFGTLERLAEVLEVENPKDLLSVVINH